MRAVAQTCYNTGDSTYSTSTTEQLTICHNNGDEGLYYSAPQYISGTQYGQIMYNVQSLRIAPDTYRTVLHTGPMKLFDSSNCPLSDLGEPGWPSSPPPPPPGLPTYSGWVPANPGYGWCIEGDSVQEASYNATGPTDTTPYTMGSTPGYVLWGSETKSPTQPTSTATPLLNQLTPRQRLSPTTLSTARSQLTPFLSTSRGIRA